MEQLDATGVGGAGPPPASANRGFRWWVRRILTWSALAGIALVCLMFLEAGFGHDGLLCELGYDTDGPGETTSGCGGLWDDE